MWKNGALLHHWWKYKWFHTAVARSLQWWDSSWAISNPKRWCCESAALNMPANLENSAVATGLEKVSFHSNPKERAMNIQTTTQLHSSHTLAKSNSKFSKPGFNCTWTENLQMFNLDLEKAEEPEFKLPTKKQENSRKTSTSALLTTLKSFTVWITTNCGKFFKRWEYQTTLCASRNLHAGQEAIVTTGHGTTN